MKTTSFSQHLGTYFDEYLPNVRNYSPNTIASYQDTFRLLLEYMAEQQHIKPYLLDYKHFSDKVILSFLNWLETHRNCSPSTRNQRLSAISAFFKYASQRSISALKICSNIASIPPKKTPRHIFSYFSVEELRVLLQMPDPRKPLERRDIVLLSLLYDSGARAQELCGIRVGDIRFSNPASVLLHGKGGKSRVVPLMNRPTRILQQFIAERKCRKRCSFIFKSARRTNYPSLYPKRYLQIHFQSKEHTPGFIQ